jgi:hypothetical protein
MKTSLLSLLLCLFSTVLFAQENTYQVLLVQGNILSNGKAVTTNTSLTSTRSIEITDEKSYLCLLSTDKKEVIEVSQKGIFQLKNLPKSLITNNYERFVIEELLDANYEKKENNRFLHMNKTGSAGLHRRMIIVPILPFERLVIYGNLMIVKWYLRVQDAYTANISSYKVEIYNLNENLLFEEKTKQTQVNIDFLKHQSLQKENILILRIIPLDKNGKELVPSIMIEGDGIIRLAPEQHKQITQEIEAIKLKNTAFSKLVEARFFEDKELYIDALVAYEDALKLSSGAKEVQKTYQFFLQRNGLIDSEEE